MLVTPYTERAELDDSKLSIVFAVRRSRKSPSPRCEVENLLDIRDLMDGLSFAAFKARARLLDDTESGKLFVEALASLVDKSRLRVNTDPELFGPYAVHCVPDSEDIDQDRVFTADKLEGYINALSKQQRKRFFNAALIK